jgi:hypothetical protein
MFIFDVETLGKKSSAVILSMAAVHFDPVKKPSFEEMKSNAFFVKLNAKDQISRLKRSTTKSTMGWWAKQCELVKVKSFVPQESDVIFEDGYEMLRKWVHSFNDNKSWVWARGNLDQLVMDDIEEQLGIDPVFPYARWRDVRTAVDIFYNTENGYVDVDYPGYNFELNITKHDPVDDCLADAMQLLYGVERKV